MKDERQASQPIAGIEHFYHEMGSTKFREEPNKFRADPYNLVKPERIGLPDASAASCVPR